MDKQSVMRVLEVHQEAEGHVAAIVRVANEKHKADPKWADNVEAVITRMTDALFGGDESQSGQQEVIVMYLCICSLMQHFLTMIHKEHKIDPSVGMATLSLLALHMLNDDGDQPELPFH